MGGKIGLILNLFDFVSLGKPIKMGQEEREVAMSSGSI